MYAPCLDIQILMLMIMALLTLRARQSNSTIEESITKHLPAHVELREIHLYGEDLDSYRFFN